MLLIPRATCSISVILFSVYWNLASAASPTASREKCVSGLGCFSITPDFFHPLYRPVNFLPADREKINTKFMFYTRDNPKTAFFLRANDNETLKSSGFDPKRKTKVIIHGWIDNQVFVEWIREMKDEFLLLGDYNVILVDWSGGNGLPYTQATANTRLVGAELAQLIKWLQDSRNLRLEDCHILGHSLGAHIAGYAGERLNKLGRITGLDPAEPYFQNMPPSVRLDPTDAVFVDAVHTDSSSILSGGFGMSQLVGHVDFFPNGGSQQPGCSRDKFLRFVTEGLVGGALTFVACNHIRAIDFVMDSINRHQCIYTGYACPDWDTFQEGKCSSCGSKGELCAQIGEDTSEHYFQTTNGTIQRAFYLKTGPAAPYCLYHYRVTVSLQANSGKDQTGKLTVTLRGTNADESFQLGDGKKINLYHGASYTFLVATAKDLGEIASATFSWNAGNLLPWPRKYVYLEAIKIIPMSIMDESARTTQTRYFCASAKNEVVSKYDVTLSMSDLCK